LDEAALSHLDAFIACRADRLKPCWMGFLARHPVETRARQWKTSLPVQKLADSWEKYIFLQLPRLQNLLRSSTLHHRLIFWGVRRIIMTQAQVAAYLADKIGISKKQAKGTLDEITALVVRELKREGSLRLAGLGIFRKRRTKARMGRNPATGAQIKIPARTRLRFTPAKALKDSVLGGR
jgi:DNA-binding protein HU-beta